MAEWKGYNAGYREAIDDVIRILDNRCTEYLKAKLVDKAEAVDVSIHYIKEECKYEKAKKFYCDWCKKELDGGLFFCSENCAEEFNKRYPEE